MNNGQELALKITEMIDKAPNVIIKRKIQKRKPFKIQQGRNAITLGCNVYLDVCAFDGELDLFSFRTEDKYTGPIKNGYLDLFNAQPSDFQLGNRAWANPTSVYYHWQTNKNVKSGRIRSYDYVTDLAQIVRYTDGAEIITPEDLYWAWDVGPHLRAIWGDEIDRKIKDKEEAEKPAKKEKDTEYHEDNSVFENTGDPIDFDNDDVF